MMAKCIICGRETGDSQEMCRACAEEVAKWVEH